MSEAKEAIITEDEGYHMLLKRGMGNREWEIENGKLKMRNYIIFTLRS